VETVPIEDSDSVSCLVREREMELVQGSFDMDPVSVLGKE